MTSVQDEMPVVGPRRARSLQAALAAAAVVIATAGPAATWGTRSAHAQDAPAAQPAPGFRPAPAPDPSPLTGSTPKDPAADAAFHRIDAAQQHAAEGAYAHYLNGVYASDKGESPTATPGAQPPSGGRTGLQGNFRLAGPLDQLDAIRMRTTGIQLEPTPEIAHTLAAEAWERFTIEQANQVVIKDRRPDTPAFQGRFKPQSIDDLPPVLPIRVPKSTTVVPSPVVAPPAATSSGWIPAGFAAKGVLIGFDEGAIREAMAAGKVPTVAEADAAEAALLSAGGDEVAASRALAAVAANSSASARPEVTVRAISLRGALDAAKAGPGAAQPLGKITRVVGAVLAQDGDVKILGREEDGVPPLTLDDVAVTLATVWRDDLVPGCSLDPEPRDPGGPQHVRIIGVPSDSAFALTMLDADYAMKKILCGVEDIGVEGVVNVADLFMASPEAASGARGEQRNRFWLCPVPPRPGALGLSTDGRTLTLSCAVEVRTEEMLLGERGDRGTGKTSPSAEQAAAAFSARYDAVARVRPVFRRLQGYFDLTLLARALRVIAPGHPLLVRACAVPRAPVKIPASYAGVSTSRSSGIASITISGGCDVGVPFERRVLRRLSDEDARQVVAIAAQAAGGGGVGTIRMPVVSPASTGEAGAGGGVLGALTPSMQSSPSDDLEPITAALVAGENDAAIALADDVLERDPRRAKARALRAEAFRALGRRGPALRDATAATILEPDDIAYQSLARRIRMDAEGAAAMAGASSALRAEVVRTEIAAAASALVLPDGAAALKAAERALMADARSYEASMIAASAAWMEDRLDDADRHLAVARASKPAAPEARVLSSMVHLSRRELAAARADLDAAIAAQPEGDALGLRGLVRLIEGDVAGAADDAEQAVALAPRSELASAAVQFAQMAAHVPLEDVQRYVGELFSLPVKSLMGLGGALAAAQKGDIVEAAAGYEAALAALDAAGRPPDAARTRIEVALLGLVPAAGVASHRPVDEILARVEALTSTLEARGDAPVTTQFARALAENSIGRRDAAIERIDAACAALGRPDVCLAELFPGRGPAVEALLRTIQLAPMIADPQELMRGERVPALLAKFETLLAGGPGAIGAKGLSEFIEAMRKDPASNQFSPEVHAALRARVDEITKAFATGKASLADAVVADLFLAIASQSEMALGDLKDAESMAKAFWSVPTPDEMSAQARVLIPQIRAQSVNALVERWMREAEHDPEMALADPDDAEAVARIRRVFAERRKRAEAFGEPAFALAFDAKLAAVEAHLGSKALEKRAAAIERVLAVAAPGAKRDRLAADLVAVRKQLEDARSGLGSGIRERVAKAYGAATTLTQLRTLDKVLASIAASAGTDAMLWVAPEDAGLEALKKSLQQARDRAKGVR